MIALRSAIGRGARDISAEAMADRVLPVVVAGLSPLVTVV